MESLSSMQSFLQTRPSSFSSVSNCIEWRYVYDIHVLVWAYLHSDCLLFYEFTKLQVAEPF